MRTRDLALATVLALITTLSALPYSVTPVYGVILPDPTLWRPYGPHIERLVLKAYIDPYSELQAFGSGQLDVTDSLFFTCQPLCLIPEGENPDFAFTLPAKSLVIFEVDINHYTPVLGVVQQQPSTVTGSDSALEPTPAGIELRRAFAHLLDKPSFVTLNTRLGGGGYYVDIQAAGAQSLFVNGTSEASRFTGSPEAQAEIDKDKALHPWFTGSLVSAYNLVSDALIDPFNAAASYGYPGAEDLRAAYEHLLAAGLRPVSPLPPDGPSCTSSTGCTPRLKSNGMTFDFYIRKDTRLNVGTIISDAIDSLFDAPVVTRRSIGILEAGDIIFNTRVVDDWHLYTAGWSLSAIPEHLYGLYYSQFASNVCGGRKSSYGYNYVIWCDPAYDEEAEAGVSAATLGEAYRHFANAAVIAHEKVMTIPVYSSAGHRFVALNGWDGLVNVLGTGFQQKFWSYLSMRQRQGYSPTDSRYTPGGGDATLARIGLAYPTKNLNPFLNPALPSYPNSVDLEVLSAIYDTLLRLNPLNPSQLIDWMTVSHSVTVGPDGNTILSFRLRNDLRWHDGVPVTADDVAFSITKYAQTQFYLLGGFLGATVVEPKTVEVKMAGVSIFHILTVGSLLIAPRHIWSQFTDTQLMDPNFDPMTATTPDGSVGPGILAGSGPFVCQEPSAGSTGPKSYRCAQKPDGIPAGQTLPSGDVCLIPEGCPSGRFLLKRYDGYMRGSPGVRGSSYDRFSWADRDNDGRVSILDVASVALKFGLADDYWDRPDIGSVSGQVDIAEVATVAFYFDHALVSPIAKDAVTGLDPVIDTFSQ